MVAMIDSGGSNRITAAGGNFDGTVLFNSGGLQNHTQLLAEMASHNHGITDPGHAHNFTAVLSNTSVASAPGASIVAPQSPTTGATTTNTTGITATGFQGSGSPFTILPPVLMLNKQVKY